MKWFFWFAIFWMLPCISDGPDVTCSGPVMIVKIRTPSPCGSCASEALRPSGGEGRRVPPPLPACLRYTNLQFLWSHAGDSTCVCVCARVCECERQSPCTLFFSFHLNLLLLLCLSTSNLAARDLRGRRCALCFWREEEGEWGWSGWWRDERGQVRRRHRSAPFLFPPSPSLSLLLSLPLSLSLCDVVCVRVCCVCLRERVKQVGYASADWTVNLHRRKQPFPDWGMSLNCHHTHFHNTCATWGDLWLSERRDAEGGRNWLKGQRILSSNHTLR